MTDEKPDAVDDFVHHVFLGIVAPFILLGVVVAGPLLLPCYFLGKFVAKKGWLK